MSERRISTPLVLALTSGMLAISAVVYLSLETEAPAQETSEHDRSRLHVDDSTPEAVSESFYDAWRRRRWTVAKRLSVGEAWQAVMAKQAGDEAMPHDERIIAERGWDALAQAPLTLQLDQVDIDGDDRYTLHGVAEYEFVGAPYRRRVVMHVRGTEEGFRVARMDLGEVLTELPAIFRGAEP